MKRIYLMTTLILSFVFISGTVLGGKKKTIRIKPDLTEKGKTLEAKYNGLLEKLKAEIVKELPTVDQAKVKTWKAAIKVEERLAKEVDAKVRAVAKMKAEKGKLKKLEEQQKNGPKTLADAKEELQRAKAKGEEDPEKEKLLASAEKFLASRKKEFDALPRKIAKAKAAVKEAEQKLPEAIKDAEAVKQAHENAMAAMWKAMDALGIGNILGSDSLDGKLAQYMVIKEATPPGLAEFAQQSSENEELIHKLLADKDLMIQTLVADGPNSGKYAAAMTIYTDIQKASPKAKEGVLQRLALATALVNATPITIRKPDIDKDKTEYLDPVKRYLNYEKWYLDGELDKGFKNLSVWNLAMVVGGNDADEVYAWGRKMLHNYRPDLIPKDGDTSKYVDVVDAEIQYSSKNVKDDVPDLHFKQNILANGGICGRRAFFGRFILRAFGVPTTARKQPGHATLAHWHPEGWKTRLGGNWGRGARGNYSSMNRVRSNPYGADVNFLASSQAREDTTAFMKVKRAQWIGAMVGENPVPGFVLRSGKQRKSKKSKKPVSEEKLGFWNELALHEQKRIIHAQETKTDTKTSVAAAPAKEPVATGKVVVDDKGVITIPAAACNNPTESTKTLYRGRFVDRVLFMNDSSGNTNLHIGRYSSGNDSFEYSFDAPKAGKYQLVATVVTPKPNLKLRVSVNGGKEEAFALPYTLGMWEKTKPIEINLVKGKNQLKFSGPCRATFKDFSLTPK